MSSPLYLLDLALQQSAMVVLVAVALGSIPRRRVSAAARHCVWALTVASVLALPLLTVLLPARTGWLASGRSSAAEWLEVRIADVEALAALDLNGLVPAPDQTPAPLPEGAVWVLRLPWIAWLVGAALFGGRLLWGAVVLARRLRDRREAPEVWRRDCTRLARRAGIARSPRLTVASEIQGPLCRGLWASEIVLPVAASGWSAPMRRTVLLHELAHVERRDAWTNLMAELACVVAWYHPLVWMAAARLRVERESACDDRVLAAGVEPSVYARTLVDSARLLGRSATRLALTLSPPARALRERLRRALDAGIARTAMRPRGLFLVSAAMLVVAVGLATVRLDAASVATMRFDCSPCSEETLLQRLEGGDRADRMGALEALERRARRSSFYAILGSTNSGDQSQRAAAVSALAAIGCEPALIVVSSALRDPSPIVRRAAALALGRFGGGELVKPLGELFDEQSAGARRRLAAAVRIDRGSTPHTALKLALEDPSFAVRAGAWSSLQRLGVGGASDAEPPAAGG